MDMNSAPSGERTHIGFFGRRNAGKSSLVNTVTAQELSVVSDIRGTTTDPVYKAMELLPLGAVMIIDTPGFDDGGSLGRLRVRKTMEILNKTDIAVLVVDSGEGIKETDRELMEIFGKKNIPYIIAWNKCDKSHGAQVPENALAVSALKGTGIFQLKETIGRLTGSAPERHIAADLIDPGDIAVLVTPIDAAAPKGRLILPQQQTIRDILDAGGIAAVTRETELEETLRSLGKKPALVITDSQAFGYVSRIVPEDIPLTSFSILMARYKGFLDTAVAGASAIDRLMDGDKVLISEGCTHHRQCGDIGSVKLPGLLKKYTGKSLEITLTSGREFPEDPKEFALVIHCGGCMLNEREISFRRKTSLDSSVPFTNYGIAIAHMKGILRRSTEMLDISIFDE